MGGEEYREVQSGAEKSSPISGQPFLIRSSRHKYDLAKKVLQNSKGKVKGLGIEVLAVAITLDQGSLRKLVNPSYTRGRRAFNRPPGSLSHGGKNPSLQGPRGLTEQRGPGWKDGLEKGQGRVL